MAKEIENLNGIAFADIEKINGKTDANIEKLNGAEFAAAAFGPPAVDAVSVDTDATGATSQTLSHTVGTGVGRGLVVGISQYNPTGQGMPDNPSGVTYGGTAMTRVPYSSSGEYVHLTTTVWFLVAPASGAADIVASFSATTTGASSIRAISFSGVKQGAGYYAAGMLTAASSSTSNQGTSGIDATISGLTAGQIVVDFIAIGIPGNGGIGFGGIPTSLARRDSIGTDIGSIASLQAGRYVTASGSTQAMGWTWSDASGSPDGANSAWMCIKIQADVYS